MTEVITRQPVQVVMRWMIANSGDFIKRFTDVPANESQDRKIESVNRLPTVIKWICDRACTLLANAKPADTPPISRGTPWFKNIWKEDEENALLLPTTA
jgi:hypothetical protein